MFKGLSNIASLMKNAGVIKEKVKEVQESLQTLRIEGIAGENQVMVVVNGHQQVIECRIDPRVLAEGNPQLLEALVMTATNNALGKAKATIAEKMTAATEGLGIPDMQQALSQFGLG